jgi:hypothetical protein
MLQTPQIHMPKHIEGGGRGTPAGLTGPRQCSGTPRAGHVDKCAVSQDPAVVGPATQLPPYFLSANGDLPRGSKALGVSALLPSVHVKAVSHQVNLLRPDIR